MKKTTNGRIQNEKLRALGIKVNLVLCFTVFVIVMLAIFWVVQIGLLDVFYERTRLGEFDTISDGIADSVGTDNLETVCYDYAVRYDVCIRVFGCSNGEVSDEEASIEATSNCLIHHIPRDTLSKYYLKAAENGGKWLKEMELLPESTGTGSDGRGSGRSRRTTPKKIALSVNVINDNDGIDHVIFINAEFSPLYSTVHTLNIQFRWVYVVLVIAAAVLAYLFSVRISSPIVRMNEGAAKLAAGDYSVRFNEEGYRETRELAATLNYAADEISRTDVLRKELIANVSHDLRTPLTLIEGYSEIMRDIPGERTPENVQNIIDETRRLSDLVSDMLDLSRTQAGSRAQMPVEFDLTEAVGEVMQRYSALTAHEGYDIRFTAERSVNVRADRTMMLQVIYNLVNNAVNYVGEDKAVIVSETVSDGKVRITVTDHGDGIPPEKLPDIWDRYYKVDRVHQRATVGTGLGLSIVRAILQQHGASFGVESRVGTGSSFWFELDEIPGNDPE